MNLSSLLNHQSDTSEWKNDRPVEGELDYSKLQVRLDSFRESLDTVEWNVPVTSLALSNFHFCGGGRSFGYLDLVCCSECGVRLSNWKQGEHPMYEHFKHSPTCSFMKEKVLKLLNGVYLSSEFNYLGKQLGYPDSIVEKVLSENSDDLNIWQFMDKVKENTPKEECSEDMLCKICVSKPIKEVFIPCRHLIACESCAEKTGKCYICSQNIEATVTVFM